MTEWIEDDGLIDVTSSFQGLSMPISELIDDIHRRGWDVNKVAVKDGNFVAEGKNPHGETLEALGKTDSTAVGNLLVKIMRREFMRGGNLREKLGAWNPASFEHQLPQIAQAYAGAPIYEPKAAPAWMELAQDCERRRATIAQQIAIEYTNDPVPYDDANAMREDVTKKRHIMVTRAYAHHPVWNERQMLDFRTVVDVLGHTVGGADWGWHGTCLAFASLAPMVAESAQKALFTEMLGQTAYGTIYQSWGPQKICFLEELIEKAQEKENKPGHSGVHPSQSIVPGVIPKIKTFSASSLPTKYHEDIDPETLTGSLKGYPGRWPVVWDGNKVHIGPEGAVHTDVLNAIGIQRKLREPTAFYQEGWIGPNPEGYQGEDPSEDENRTDPQTGQMYGWYGNPSPRRVPFEVNDAMLRYHQTFLRPQLQGDGGFGHAYRMGAADQLDPNANWSSGVSPLQDAAFLWQRPNGVDPLDAQSVSEGLRPLDTGIANMHPAMAQQAVVNALRGSVMGSRKNPRAHAIHYQSVMGLPARVDDPIAYWDSLEQQREAWNQGQGYAPGSHKQHWPEEQQFIQWVKSTNPQLDDDEVHRTAKRELLHMLSEEEERLLAQDPGEELTSEQIEHEAYNAMKGRLKALTKPTVDQKVDFGDDHLFHEAANIETLSPEEFVQRFQPSEYFDEHGNEDWDTVAQHPNFWAPSPNNPSRIHADTWPAFVNDIATNGIREPVVLDWYDPERVTEGHHRVVAARQANVSVPFVRMMPPVTPAKTSTYHADMYPPYLASSLRPIASISRNASRLSEAAKEDLINHKGHGHHFRATALNLGIPNLGPRQVSNAWLHLAPQTSQLGVINPDMMEILGHDPQEKSDRDYFRHERELAAGRDASGYAHVPLGAFSAGLHDLKVGGEGHHPDRTPFKPYSPTPHRQVDWTAQAPAYPNWPDPYWWNSTQEARDQVAQDFDRNVAVDHSKDTVPYQRTSAVLSASGPSPWVIHPQTGQRVTGAPGTSLMSHLKQTFGHPSVREAWEQEYELGKA